jgi:methyl-accepting chemotaxis protein
MNKIVQMNAANAEESASVSEEMRAQTESLNEYVGDLVTIITGRNGTNNGNREGLTKLSYSNNNFNQIQAKKQLAIGSKAIKPNQIIPHGDNNFKDF